VTSALAGSGLHSCGITSVAKSPTSHIPGDTGLNECALPPQESTFEILAHDRRGERQHRGGDVFTVKVSGLARESPVPSAAIWLEPPLHMRTITCWMI
jgi:hypothetical protein